jgi:putative exporter of polyketide antibiotics
MTQRDNDDRLEELLGRAVRDLPLRRAPLELESRVRSELERRRAPWWRQSLAHWPLPARCALLALCCVLVGLTLWEHRWVAAGVQQLIDAGVASFSWLNPLLSAIAFTAATTGVVERAIPMTWIYVALTLGAALYATLFGLGAAAYRTLYTQSSNGRYLS